LKKDESACSQIEINDVSFTSVSRYVCLPKFFRLHLVVEENENELKAKFMVLGREHF